MSKTMQVVIGGFVAILVLMFGVYLGNRSVLPTNAAAKPTTVQAASATSEAVPQSYPDQVRQRWDELIKYNKVLELQLSKQKPDKKTLVRTVREMKERFQNIEGQLQGMPVPAEYEDRRNELIAGIKSNRSFLDRLDNILIGTGVEQDLADMASNGESAGDHYRLARFPSFEVFPDTVFNVQGKVQRLMAKEEPKPESGGSSSTGEVAVRDEYEKLYVTELKDLVRAYDASRKAFNRELNSGAYYSTATASGAYKQRNTIRERLQRLSAPTRFLTVHSQFESVLDESLQAISHYYSTRDRYQLGQDSRMIGARLTAVKRALGIR